MNTIRGKTAIVGAAFSTVSRRGDVPLGVLAMDAVRGAAADAGIPVSDLDGLSVYPNPSRIGAGATDGVDYVSAHYMQRALRMKEPRYTVQVDPGSFVGSVIEASQAVAAGACDYAVAWRAMHNPKGRFGAYTSREAGGPDQYLGPYGLMNQVAINGLVYSRYLEKYGATREDMAHFAVNNRLNASRNPEAVWFGKPITHEQYVNDPMVAYPFSRLDCDMSVDGAGAVIVTSAERAKDLRSTPAYLLGYASLGNERGYHVTPTLEDIERGGRHMGRVLWESAGVGPKDIDQANVYDGFSMLVYTWLEALGYCGPGEAHEFVRDGRIAVDGELPLNTSGGSLGMGRLHGTAQLIEAVRQIQGVCGENQVADVNLTQACSGAPFWGCGSVVLGRDPQ
ncbi:thiolase C-terminal domain-containing protein [Granulicoccus phenolivorans]|uniref:thiolase C-terminal domain-containing protein n=1 Tax=Granulicoccus phenolivorans TaxID=266854 RepID=UPI0003F9DE68|nr:hypothetical protein [Granulicoccus phenolivorans]